MNLFSRIIRRFQPSYHETRSVRESRITFYRQFVRAGDLVFDVGANTGNRVDAFLSLGARVLAVEPQDECVRILRRRFRTERTLMIEPVALGAREGEVTLHLTSVSAIASASRQFIEATHASGRFAGFDYTAQRTVPMTTLDALVARYGEPAFIKIDVEGYEASVLSGLTRAPSSLRGLSFEFTPELLDVAERCLERLAALGAMSANYSLGESMQLALDDWAGLSQVPALLSPYGNDTFGDIYVRWS